MRTLNQHLRSLLVAVAALSISAGVVFASAAVSGVGPADAATDGLKRAAEQAGSAIPARPVQSIKAAKDNKGTKVVTAADRPLNHGWYVSLAAKAATPAGYDSHGAYVSTIAKGDQGKPAAATGATNATEQSAKGQATAAAAKAKAAQRKAARQP